ncbi:hypothetical protein SGP15004_25140 [Shigella flexneri]|uniref:Uncharacterized protein n=1 Tax=Shigella flexneri 2a str. 301 TaxID=198214 RepID=A0AB36PCS3_SHIFL|nr:hypothetical protein SF2457T_0798 [Shigella flexneri 2a str. 2457T]OXB27613.1 hypothetical protein SF301_4046 [Shigella flexneri 2a str. 301]GLG08689.1 hypothetical protein SGP12012_22850 [Shigella flexneri]GLG13558.1 hypothetical protein SGP12048_28300 [Shigella flexneri]GLG18070.1 hypothetical protein SGP12049_28810 [Shigella flexneri]
MFNLFVSDNLQKKNAETASDKPSQGKLVTTESIGWATKKVLGLILNLLNDTN